jgi:hypothetical protein
MLRATKKKLGPIILYTKLPSEAIYIYIYNVVNNKSWLYLKWLKSIKV